MTENTNPTPALPLHLRLPAFRVDYAAGQFHNTQSGEIEQSLTGVILAYREDRVYWPALADPNPTPLCVNGSKYGPCITCLYAQFGRDNTPPTCSDELTVLLRLVDGSVVTLTARRSMVRPIDQFLGMHDLLGDGLYSQQVKLHLTPGTAREDGFSALHVLRLTPGEYLESAELTRMEVLAARVDAPFREGALE